MSENYDINNSIPRDDYYYKGKKQKEKTKEKIKRKIKRKTMDKTKRKTKEKTKGNVFFFCPFFLIMVHTPV